MVKPVKISKIKVGEVYFKYCQFNSNPYAIVIESITTETSKVGIKTIKINDIDVLNYEDKLFLTAKESIEGEMQDNRQAFSTLIARLENEILQLDE